MQEINQSFSGNFTLKTLENVSSPLYYALCSYFLNWYLPIILNIGFLGTIFCLVFIVYSGFFSSSLMLWLISICVGDFMILSWDGARMMVKSLWHKDLRDGNLYSCIFQLFFSNYFLYWSSYMQAAMSIHRCYYIIRPLRARSQLTMRRLWMVWWIITLTMILPIIPYPVFWRLRDDGDCQPTDNIVFYITTVLDTLILGCIPLITMVCTTVIIIVTMMAQNADFAISETNASSSMSIPALVCNLSVDDTSPTINPPCKDNIGSPLLRFPNSSRGLSEDNNERRKRQSFAADSVKPSARGQRHGGSLASKHPTRHVTRLLLTMNIWYLTTTFPIIVYFLHLNFVLGNQVGVTISKDMHKFCYYLLRSLCYLNCSFNWFFYCFSSSVFRNRVKEMILNNFCHRGTHPSRLSKSMSHSSSGWMPGSMNYNPTGNSRYTSYTSVNTRRSLTPESSSCDFQAEGIRRPRSMSYAFEMHLNVTPVNMRHTSMALATTTESAEEEEHNNPE